MFTVNADICGLRILQNTNSLEDKLKHCHRYEFMNCNIICTLDVQKSNSIHLKNLLPSLQKNYYDVSKC